MEANSSTITVNTPLRKLLESYKGAYRVLLCAGIKLSPLTISYNETLGKYLTENNREEILSDLNHIVRREHQDFDQLENIRHELIQPGKVNMAGFADFTWHEAFIEEMEKFANTEKIPLNHQFFQKNNKKAFQFYLAQCENPDELPDILVGKGFSSLMTRRFVDRFVKPGYFDTPLKVNVHELWNNSGLYDTTEQYHAFGAEELVILHDKSKEENLPIPTRWSDLLSPVYADAVTQMGKPQRDHFGSNMLFYLHQKYGEQGIRNYARSVKFKWHFSKIIKDIGKNHPESSPFNVVQRYTTLFVRSNADVEVLSPKDGNPVSTFFLLVKKGSNEQVLKIARHFFSKEIAGFLENAGAISAHPDSETAANANIRWLGWETIKNSSLPYQKDYFSEIAFEVFENKD
ncbi:ABC transporter substrate-binding protein [Parabacteroides sp. FAFU027]|uniref:ABC transporter substrate-binding protein n=1 Tax=Parabacteroides sp. FAFU027 TaxID=2922715 RepID=UPI001FAE902A|nr:ABC transporter substrate-binding protein [Parabacteroides sp. FAFU027]